METSCSLYLFLRRVIKWIVGIIEVYHFCQLHTKFYPSCWQEEVTGELKCGFQCSRSTIDQVFCICQILEKKWEYNEAVRQLFIDFKKAGDKVRKEVLYNVLIQFGIRMELVRLIRMCLNEIYCRVWIDKYLSDVFPVKNVLKEVGALLPLL